MISFKNLLNIINCYQLNNIDKDEDQDEIIINRNILLKGHNNNNIHNIDNIDIDIDNIIDNEYIIDCTVDNNTEIKKKKNFSNYFWY